MLDEVDDEVTLSVLHIENDNLDDEVDEIDTLDVEIDAMH
jgi:hypothetical protein